ncbi:MAG: nucleoside-triphosphatase [Oscillibacter sp.]|nr:nucleoside-triphosphatase [Oscillibacter sp.]
MHHILLCGEVGAGKSTLIRRLLSYAAMPISGFVTKRQAEDETGFHPIYIHPAAQAENQRVCSEDNLVGTCDRRTHNIRLEAFDTLGARYIRSARPGSILVMDELGFMEAQASLFTAAVFIALDESVPVLAAVKARYDVPFLNQVRAHPNAVVYTVTTENRDVLYRKLLKEMDAWKKSSL